MTKINLSCGKASGRVCYTLLVLIIKKLSMSIFTFIQHSMYMLLGEARPSKDMTTL